MGLAASRFTWLGSLSRPPTNRNSVGCDSSCARRRNKGFGNHNRLASASREERVAAQRKKAVLMSPPSVGDLSAQLVKRGMVAPLLSVVVPVKNEEDAILPFVTRVGAILEAVAADSGREILFVDHRRTDATLAAMLAAHQLNPPLRPRSLPH